MLKKEKTKTNNMRVNAGKLLLDVAKLTFGSFILGGILRGEVPQYILIIAGIVVFSVCAILGLIFTTEKIENKDKE